MAAMAAILMNSGAECMFSLPRHPISSKTWRRRKSNVAWCKQSEREVVFRRRQMLLASTSTSVRVPLMPSTNNPPSNPTDFQKMQAAQKLKFKYSSDVDVASLFSSSNSAKGGVPGEFSGMVSVPSQHYCLGNYDFVQAKVSRPRFGSESRADLVIEGIKVEREKPLWFDVYLRPACREEEDIDEYVGSFIHIPPGQKQQKGICRCSLRLEISEILEDFDFDSGEHQESVVVTLVPKFNANQLPIAAENVCIQKA